MQERTCAMRHSAQEGASGRRRKAALVACVLGSLLAGAVAMAAPASGQRAEPPGLRWRAQETAGVRPLATEDARDIALASTWHLDRALLRPHATDSTATAAARRELAAINERLSGVM